MQYHSKILVNTAGETISKTRNPLDEMLLSILSAWRSGGIHVDFNVRMKSHGKLTGDIL